ncbi:hypothetical protein AB205_0024350 [Aquarana catesbeiana]|uniref:RanBD1 domain-containing protein n=1 Tax=Aquarana catesbeiana TaxID=8400 RepID=A0A2G9RMS5_AQUCT|nr:hypothetical protein AB205_0024350 [Aquarana catesbeiana]
MPAIGWAFVLQVSIYCASVGHNTTLLIAGVLVNLPGRPLDTPDIHTAVPHETRPPILPKVMRTQGSLRLILNTKLWAQMQIDKASEKSIRITAMDTEDQGVKVFLISASSKDTGQLFAAIHHRILALRSHVEQETETKCPEPVREVAQCNEEDSDDDDDVLTPAVTTTVGKYTCTRVARAIFSIR